MLGSRKAAWRFLTERPARALARAVAAATLAVVVASVVTVAGCNQDARQEHLRAGRQAMAKGEWDRAIARFTSALALLDENETEERTRIESQIAEAEYQTALAAAKERLNQPEYAEVLKRASPPQRVMDTGEVQLPTTEINYRRYLGQGKSYMRNGQYRRALAVLKMAQRAKDTIEAQGLIQQTAFLAAEQEKKQDNKK
jgi:tetratricopeptide (TPR) repeat protein